jgi:glycosyltransferase involved in cell wall biosynthesis
MLLARTISTLPSVSLLGRSRTGAPPPLSVVMAARNAERYVREAIESVLSQTMGDFEFIIVDDASTDDTREILSSYSSHDSRIRVLTNTRQLGPFPSANRGIKAARAPVIARQDADDASAPERFAIQLETLNSSPDVSLVSGPVEVCEGDSGTTTRVHFPRAWQPRLEWDLLFMNAGGTSANVMFPRLLRGVPTLYPAKHRYAEDYGLWCTLSQRGRVLSVSRALYRYREHGRSITARNRLEQDECARQIRRVYGSRFFPGHLSIATVEEALRFWARDASATFVETPLTLASILEDLRIKFLEYVERRYGRRDRAILAMQIDQAFSERLAFWLFRALRLLEAGRCGELLSIAGTRGETLCVSSKAASQLVSAAIQKVARRMTIERRAYDDGTEPSLRSVN